MPDGLKRVLVIDNRELYAPAGAHADLVCEMATADAETLDPAEWAAVFVHADNEPELNWAIRHKENFGGVYFTFSGERGMADNVTTHRGAYLLPRWAFQQRFERYLTAYRALGVADAETASIFEAL